MILSPFWLTCALSSVSWIGIVGPFCVEALVKWAIIPVGESDDDFWQNGAAARCQTIRVVAISSHGRTRTHRHARRLTPQTSCFSLSPQTWEIEWEEHEVMKEERQGAEGFFLPARDQRVVEKRKKKKQKRVTHHKSKNQRLVCVFVRVCVCTRLPDTQYPHPMPLQHCCSHSNKIQGGGRGVKKRGSVLKIREEFCCYCCLDLTNLVLRL